MPIENCTLCGKVFNRTIRDICLPCWESEQGWVDQITEFLHAHPEATANTVIDLLGIHEDDLAKLLKRGRLVGYEQLSTLLKCQRCGAPAADRSPFCASCRSVVVELAGPAAEPEPEEAWLDKRAKPAKGPTPKPGPGLIRPDSGLSRHWRER